MKKPTQLGVYENGELVAVATKAGVVPVHDPSYLQLQTHAQVEQNAKIIDLFLIQFRAQMRSLAAADIAAMGALCELINDEVEALLKEHYPNAD